MTAKYFLFMQAGIHTCQGGLGAQPDQVRVRTVQVVLFILGVSEFLPLARDALSANRKTYLSLEVKQINSFIITRLKYLHTFFTPVCFAL